MATEWAVLGTTIITALRDLFRWRRIKKVKEYENDPDVIAELDRRAAAAIERLHKNDSAAESE